MCVWRGGGGGVEAKYKFNTPPPAIVQNSGEGGRLIKDQAVAPPTF